MVRLTSFFACSMLSGVLGGYFELPFQISQIISWRFRYIEQSSHNNCKGPTAGRPNTTWYGDIPRVSFTDVRKLQNANGSTLCHEEGISAANFEIICFSVALLRTTKPAALGLYGQWNLGDTPNLSKHVFVNSLVKWVPRSNDIYRGKPKYELWIIILSTTFLAVGAREFIRRHISWLNICQHECIFIQAVTHRSNNIPSCLSIGVIGNKSDRRSLARNWHILQLSQ